MTKTRKQFTAEAVNEATDEVIAAAKDMADWRGEDCDTNSILFDAEHRDTLIATAVRGPLCRAAQAGNWDTPSVAVLSRRVDAELARRGYPR